MVRLALVQSSAVEDKASNVERAVRRVREAADRGADVVCLSELFATRYPCQSEDPARFDLAEAVPGPTTDRMAAVARDLGVVLVVPIFERRAAGLYHNSLAVLSTNGEIVGRYRKMHIPDDPSYFEKFYFAPGDLGFVAIDTPFAKLGPLICWDQWYPEAARLTVLRGAEVLLYPTAIGWFPSEREGCGDAQLEAWRTIQRAHAIANGVYVASVNRVGVEDDDGEGICFWGHSFVCDPFGRVLAEAGEDEEVLIADCDLSLVEQVRRDWPFLRDRRVDAYTGIDARMLDVAAR